MPKKKVAIVIPCLNEAARIIPKKYFSFTSVNPDIDFCFVNDASSDGTLDLIKTICADPRFFLCRLS